MSDATNETNTTPTAPITDAAPCDCGKDCAKDCAAPAPKAFNPSDIQSKVKAFVSVQFVLLMMDAVKVKSPDDAQKLMNNHRDSVLEDISTIVKVETGIPFSDAEKKGITGVLQMSMILFLMSSLTVKSPEDANNAAERMESLAGTIAETVAKTIERRNSPVAPTTTQDNGLN
jgi:hypothetical protein